MAWSRTGSRVPAGPARAAVGCALLAAAAAGQAIAQAVVHAQQDHPAAVPGAVPAVEYAVPLLAFALLATLPLLFFRPLAAALAIAAANAASLAWFGTATAAGIAAQLIAGYRLGRQGELRGPEALAAAAPGRGRRAGAAVRRAGPDQPRGRNRRAARVGRADGGGGRDRRVRARRETRTRTAAGEALADTLTEHTVRGERARIARELHDVVAHHISMVAVQAETARLTTPGLPAAGAQRFTEIGDTARAGLTEMRRLLGVLREDAEDAGDLVADRRPQPGLPQLAELIDAAREATASRRPGSSSPARSPTLDPGVELAAYRIVQEALTNARRHAPGAAVDVELRYDDHALHLRDPRQRPRP